MSYVSLLGECANCHNIFSSNPNLVPNVKGKIICRDCIDWVNARREALGMPKFIYDSTAYETIPEEDMITW